MVEVRGLNGKGWLDQAGNFVGEGASAVERFRLTGKDTLEYEATVTNPKVFSRPFTVRVPLRRRPADVELLEYGCIEGERDAAHLPPAERRAKSDAGDAFLLLLLAAAWAQSHQRQIRQTRRSSRHLASQGQCAYRNLESEKASSSIPPTARFLTGRRPARRSSATSRSAPQRIHCSRASSPAFPARRCCRSRSRSSSNDDRIAIVYQHVHAYRVIFTDGRPHYDDGIEFYMGDSRGRWEGNTLRGRRDQLQARDLARRRGPLPQQQAACGRALHAHRSEHACVTRRPSKIPRSSSALGPSGSNSRATPSPIFSWSSTNATGTRKASTGIRRSS